MKTTALLGMLRIFLSAMKSLHCIQIFALAIILSFFITMPVQAEPLIVNPGETVQLEPGEYSFDSVDIGATGTLQLIGDTTLNVAGNVSIAATGSLLASGNVTLQATGNVQIFMETYRFVDPKTGQTKIGYNAGLISVNPSGSTPGSNGVNPEGQGKFLFCNDTSCVVLNIQSDGNAEQDQSLWSGWTITSGDDSALKLTTNSDKNTDGSITIFAFDISLILLPESLTKELMDNPGVQSVLDIANGDQADLSLVKAGSPNPALVGDTITYTYTIANAGPQASQSVRLHDILPEGISFSSFGTVSGGGVCAYSFSPRALECLWNSLASGTSVQAQIIVTANQAGLLSNTANVTSDTADPNMTNNSSTANITVKTPNQPPKALCRDVTVTAGTTCTASASINNGSYDPDGDSITVVQFPAGPYSLGSTQVTLTVTDINGAASSCTGAVTVVDTTPPTITTVSANPSVLWPSNHKMVPVSLVVQASDTCDPNPICTITSVTSNEPENGLGDGDIAPDWEINNNLIVNLRSERSGKGNGRIYTITVRCTDVSLNSSIGNVNVSVPHHLGSK